MSTYHKVPHQRVPLWLRNARRRECYGKFSSLKFYRVQITQGNFAGMFGTTVNHILLSPNEWVYGVELYIFGHKTTQPFPRSAFQLRRLDRRRRKTHPTNKANA